MEETMIDRTNFMETLRSVAELTRTSHEPLSREEVMSYFSDIELTKEQQELVYQYILQPKEEEQQGEELQEEVQQENEELEESEEKSHLFELYQEDIKSLPSISKEEESKLYIRLSKGDEEAVQLLVDLWLPRVVAMLNDYRIHQVNMEDLLQEGNLGLISVLSRLLGDSQVTRVEEYIRESIKKAMEDYIDESVEDKDWESTVVAKATLVHEATEALARELGRTPTIQELSEYTRLSIEEIEDVIKLSETSKDGK